MTFVMTSVGLQNNLSYNCDPSILRSSLRNRPGLIIDWELLEVIPSLWKFSQSIFYRAMRRCVQVQKSLPDSHADLLSDNSHRTWAGLTNRLFDITQLQRERVWTFSSKVADMVDLVEILSLPSITVAFHKLESLLTATELCLGAACQFSSFLGTTYEQPLLSSNTGKAPFSEHLTSVQHQTSSETSLMSILDQFLVQFRNLQKLIAMAPEFRVIKRQLSSPVMMTRLSVHLLRSIVSIITSMQHRVESFCGSWKQFFEVVLKQSGVPYSARCFFGQSLSSFLKIGDVFTDMENSSRAKDVTYLDFSAELTQCSIDVRDAFKKSRDLVGNRRNYSILQQTLTYFGPQSTSH